MNRREFLLTAGGTATAASAAAGTAAAQDGGNETGGNETGGGGGGNTGPIDYGDWFSDVPYWESSEASTVDATGQEEVTVTVGGDVNNGWSFLPAAVYVDPGTTVLWEWTGEGGGHNVVSDSVPEGAEQFSSGSPVGEAGTTYELTFETEGIYTYYCNPHLGNGMKGAVAVGNVPRQAAQTGPPTRTEPDPNHMGVPIQAHFVGAATILAIVASLVFTFFLLKYGESPNTKGGNN
jgi:halocyanin-like protein